MRILLTLVVVTLGINNVMSHPFWQSRLNSRHVKKLNGVINVPEFSVESGNKKCLRLSYRDAAFVHGLSDNDPHNTTDSLTVQCWVKLGEDASETYPATWGYVIYANGEPGVDATFILSIKDEKVRVTLVTDDAYIVTSNLDLQLNQWYNVAVTFHSDGASAGELIIYINGTQDAVFNDSGDVGIGFIQPAGTDYYVGNAIILVEPQEYFLSGLKVWNIALSGDLIRLYQHSAPSPYNVGLLISVTFRNYDVGYRYYNEVTGNLLSGLDGGWPPYDDFPHCHLYGASFVVGEFTINTGKSFSLNAPIIPPDCVTFVPCISYTVENCNCPFPLTKRYQLWHYHPEECDENQCGEDLVPGVEDYNGQVLPTGCKLEIWSIDGQELATLDEVLAIRTSILHAVTLITETDLTEDADLGDINTNIAETFPLTFPLTFNKPLVF
jgi:hypothetical protein